MYKYSLLALFLVTSGISNSGMWAQEVSSQPVATAMPDAPSAIESPSQERAISTSAKPSDQDATGLLVPGTDPDNHLMFPFIDHLAQDQKSFWLAPAHFHKQDLEWIVPFAGVTAGFIQGDSWISKQIPFGEINRSKTFSNYATYSLIGAGAGSFLLGHLRNDDQMSEAGLLSGEAAINSTAISYFIKNVARRERPYEQNGAGSFFQSGSSFPSEHAAIAWSIASVMAHEYPGTLTKILAYGLATGVSATRVTGQQHFSSDVIIGSALGWYFGRQVYRAHHDSDLGGSSWGSLLPEKSGDETRNPENMGSPAVPLDSWIYPALERLIGLGYIKTGYLGIRPWTRMECARMLEEAQQQIEDAGDQGGEALRIYSELADELSVETGRLNGAANIGMNLDSIYARTTQISGTPLRDGYHFGQTIINDYGRPYGQGFNAVGGLTAHAEAGGFFINLQGEFQNAGPSPSEPLSALQQIAAGEDGTPALSNARNAVNRVRLLDASIGFTWGGFQLSAGKQSLWLGPSYGSSFLFSDNAEPAAMVRLDRASVYVPGISRILGPVRSEFAIGRMAGTEWVFSQKELFGPNIKDQPFVHLEKISFKPTENFEFGIGVSAIFGGPGSPVTFGNFFKTYSPHCSVGECATSLAANNYGDRRSTADFSYRLPHLRDWVAVYGDSLVEDEISPIGSSRPAVSLGLHMPKVPRINKLELRAESLYTDAPNTVFVGNYYSNSHYLSGYTNYGAIMGSWIGRAGKGGQAWATYWLSPRTNFQLQYRRQVVSQKFLGGGGLNDFGMKAEIKASSNVSLEGFVQYESWNFPILAPAPKSDVTASVQLTIKPHWANTR